jgi:hypothetical protein
LVGWNPNKLHKMFNFLCNIGPYILLPNCYHGYLILKCIFLLSCNEKCGITNAHFLGVNVFIYFENSHILFVLVCVYWFPTHIVLVLVLFVFVLCTLCCRFIWIVHFWLPLRYSLTFVQLRWEVINVRFLY